HDQRKFPAGLPLEYEGYGVSPWELRPVRDRRSDVRYRLLSWVWLPLFHDDFFRSIRPLLFPLFTVGYAPSIHSFPVYYAKHIKRIRKQRNRSSAFLTPFSL